MSSSSRDHQQEAGPSSWRETSLPTASPTPHVAITKNASTSMSQDILHLARALVYLVQLILVSIRDASNDAVRLIRETFPSVMYQRHPKGALLPQYSEPVTSGSDPPLSSDDEHLRNAVLSSFIPTSADDSVTSTERTPLLIHSNNSHASLNATIKHPRHHLHIEVISVPRTSSDPTSDLTSTGSASAFDSNSDSKVAVANTTVQSDATELDTPSASSSLSRTSSENSCSTPSSSNSSFTMLRPALKKPSASCPNTPRLGLLRLDGDEGGLLGTLTGRSTPVQKSVRFNPNGNETHFFEYAPHEEHETKGSKSPASVIGRWRKNNGTIVWQDGPERPRKLTSASSSSHNRESDEEAYSRALFGQSLPGRIIYSLLLGSRLPSSLSSSSLSSSSGSGSGLGLSGGMNAVAEGRRGAHGASLGWAEEGRWRDGMF